MGKESQENVLQRSASFVCHGGARRRSVVTSKVKSLRSWAPGGMLRGGLALTILLAMGSWLLAPPLDGNVSKTDILFDATTSEDFQNVL